MVWRGPLPGASPYLLQWSTPSCVGTAALVPLADGAPHSAWGPVCAWLPPGLQGPGIVSSLCRGRGVGASASEAIQGEGGA